MTRNPKVSKQRRRNTWYLVYRPRGQTKQVWEPAGNDEMLAEIKRLEKCAQLADVEYVEPTRDSFTAVSEEWWANVAVGRYAETTLADYRSILDRHLLPTFGSLPLASIRFRAVQRFVGEKQQAGVSNKRIRNILNVLSVIFRYACKAELCRSNPVDRVERPPLERSEVDCLGPEELWSLLESVNEVQPFYYPLVLTALMTGMRLGELRSLTWDRVDFENGEIRVRSSQSRTQVKGPKTAAGWRTVPMSQLVADALTRQRSSMMAGQSLVFPSHRLTPFDPSNVRTRVLYRALDNAGLRRVTWHSLRHSAASLMAMSGANEKEIQVIMGHSSIQVTKDLYTHLFAGAKREAIDRMTELMESSKPDKAREEPAYYGVPTQADCSVVKAA